MSFFPQQFDRSGIIQTGGSTPNEILDSFDIAVPPVNPLSCGITETQIDPIRFARLALLIKYLRKGR